MTLTDLIELADYSQPHSPGDSHSTCSTTLYSKQHSNADLLTFPQELSLRLPLFVLRLLNSHPMSLWRTNSEPNMVEDLSFIPGPTCLMGLVSGPMLCNDIQEVIIRSHSEFCVVGLGTSSILAGAVMAVLWRSSGRSFNIESLNHGVSTCMTYPLLITLLPMMFPSFIQVLHLEQMLTTGGGWQDQVGGLSPGIKMGHSAAQLPLKVDIHRPVISPETVKKFGEHLVLVYTGKTRLARNLLQVIITVSLLGPVLVWKGLTCWIFYFTYLRMWFATGTHATRTLFKLRMTWWRMLRIVPKHLKKVCQLNLCFFLEPLNQFELSLRWPEGCRGLLEWILAPEEEDGIRVWAHCCHTHDCCPWSLCMGHLLGWGRGRRIHVRLHQGTQCHWSCGRHLGWCSCKSFRFTGSDSTCKMWCHFESCLFSELTVIMVWCTCGFLFREQKISPFTKLLLIPMAWPWRLKVKDESQWNSRHETFSLYYTCVHSQAYLIACSIFHSIFCALDYYHDSIHLAYLLESSQIKARLLLWGLTVYCIHSQFLGQLWYWYNLLVHVFVLMIIQEI